MVELIVTDAELVTMAPGTGPADSYWVIGMGAYGSNATGGALSPQANQAIQDGGGGLY